MKGVKSVSFSLQKFFSTLISMFFIIVLFIGCNQSYRTIDADEAQKIFADKKDYIILDVRTQEEYDKQHIPNAILLPIDEIRKGNLSVLPDKKQKILVYCWTGRRAEDASDMLTKLGYINVINFGGIVDWTGELEGSEVE